MCAGLLAYHEVDLRSKAVFLRKTGENLYLYDIIVDKAVCEAFSYVVEDPLSGNSGKVYYSFFPVGAGFIERLSASWHYWVTTLLLLPPLDHFRKGLPD